MNNSDDSIFIRLEKYALQAHPRKQGGNNIYKVAFEAARRAGYCAHVASPMQPRVIHGISPELVPEHAAHWANGCKTVARHKDGKVVVKRYRLDKAVCAAGVISAPPCWKEDDRWTLFAAACLEWLVTQFGRERLLSVVEHRDESSLHLHFFLVPMSGEPFATVHPGVKAIETVGHNASRVVRDTAYKSAMKGFLDDFQNEVGARFSLLRSTIQRKRISREAWMRKKELERARAIEKPVPEIDSALLYPLDPVAAPIKIDRPSQGFSNAPLLPAASVLHQVQACEESPAENTNRWVRPRNR